MHPAGKLRKLLKEPGPILCPGIYDCLSAKVVERAGLPCAIISGAAVTASRLGYPDVGLQTMSEILDQARNIARSVAIPVIADIDTGYGNALNVMRTISEFESAGLAGIFFEDQTFPKKCGHFEGVDVIPAEEMIIKIVDIFVAELQTRLAERNFKIELDESAKKFLAEKGYSQEYGARPLRRAVQRYLTETGVGAALFF